MVAITVAFANYMMVRFAFVDVFVDSIFIHMLVAAVISVRYSSELEILNGSSFIICSV